MTTSILGNDEDAINFSLKNIAPISSKVACEK